MIDLSNSERCPHCGRYANRGVSIDAVIIKDNKVLLIQRGTEPNKGFWGIPGGYVGWDESAEDTVKREVKEETNLDVQKLRLVGVYSSPDRHPKQVINVVYLAEVTNGQLKHGDDALDAKWVNQDELPDKLAFDHRQNIEDAKKLLARR
ncbi:MAG: NUDIX hydrolase [Patescibacteria group bacterium]|nr:NUDIX hydrolase [Patescibacteria group bacterium]